MKCTPSPHRRPAFLERRAPLTLVGAPVGNRWRSVGFTLIELMVVVAIVAILTAIALPSYTSYILKARRVTAEGCLSQYANYMERYYTTNLRYDQDSSGAANTLPSFDCSGAQQTGAYYGYSLSGLSSTAYTVQASPMAGTSQARDTLCGTLTLNQAGAHTISGSGALGQCWQG